MVQEVQVVKVATEDLVVREDQVQVAKKDLVKVVTEDLVAADICKLPIRH